MKGALFLIVVRSSKLIRVNATQQSRPSFLIINSRSAAEVKPQVVRTFPIAIRFDMVVKLNLKKTSDKSLQV